MRVIAGQFRGRSLESPPGFKTRPLTDRVKETLFNILGSRYGTPAELPPLRVLDVFAGTGGLGIEAISRGARSCVFIERDRQTLRTLRQNIEKLRLQPISNVLAENAWTMRVPASLGEAEDDGRFDLVFLDPPYRDVDDPRRMLDLLERLEPRLAPAGLVVFRYEFRSKFPLDQMRGLRCDDFREIGKMNLALLCRSEPRAAHAVD
ncbi:Ribosomal RNA small subunit methyltransferase D [Phycisphaerae bacterium RAS1]|nr:Ribosomal RNA small subunit methyltransferase D [Phycisphaerae bacterium RAS1]